MILSLVNLLYKRITNLLTNQAYPAKNSDALPTPSFNPNPTPKATAVLICIMGQIEQLNLLYWINSTLNSRNFCRRWVTYTEGNSCKGWFISFVFLILAGRISHWRWRMLIHTGYFIVWLRTGGCISYIIATNQHHSTYSSLLHWWRKVKYVYLIKIQHKNQQYK